MTDRTPRLWRLGACVIVIAAVSTAGGPTLAGAQEAPPNPGERIRLQVGPEVAGRLGLQMPWEGTFIMVRQDNLVASNPSNGGVALPLTAVQDLRVQRPRAPSYAFVRGAIVGTAFGLGMWPFLRMLCRSACNNGLGSAWFPSLVTGFGVGLLVSGQGPGTHWVETHVPAPQPEAGSAGTRR